MSGNSSAEEGEGSLSPHKFEDLQVTHPLYIYELFNIKFHNSLQVDLHFNFCNCQLELSNLLLRFGILNCKKVSLRLDQLDYKYCDLASVKPKKMQFKSRTKLRSDP